MCLPRSPLHAYLLYWSGPQDNKQALLYYCLVNIPYLYLYRTLPTIFDTYHIKHVKSQLKEGKRKRGKEKKKRSLRKRKRHAMSP